LQEAQMIVETALFISVIVIVAAIVKAIKWRRDVLSHIARSD
jgi:heme exporter protein D